MRIARIRHVKREIRVLGIAVKPSLDGNILNAVGVVFRGGLWLDGVMRTAALGKDLTERIVEMVTSSPHYPQIRIILLHEELIEGGARIDPYGLSTRTSRPVLFLSTDEAGPAALEPPADVTAKRFGLRREGSSLSILSVGLRDRDAARVIEVSTREGAMPEALRVAGLIASASAGYIQHNA